MARVQKQFNKSNFHLNRPSMMNHNHHLRLCHLSKGPSTKSSTMGLLYEISQYLYLQVKLSVCLSKTRKFNSSSQRLSKLIRKRSKSSIGKISSLSFSEWLLLCSSKELVMHLSSTRKASYLWLMVKVRRKSINVHDGSQIITIYTNHNNNNRYRSKSMTQD